MATAPWLWLPNGDSCCACAAGGLPCTDICSSGATPTSVLITIANLQDLDCNCAPLNTSYVATQICTDFGGDPDPCCWLYIPDDGNCGLYFIRLNLSVVGADWNAVVIMSIRGVTGLTAGIDWKETRSASELPINCASHFTARSLPYLSDSGGTACQNIASATCTVTAL